MKIDQLPRAGRYGCALYYDVIKLALLPLVRKYAALQLLSCRNVWQIRECVQRTVGWELLVRNLHTSVQFSGSEIKS